jgi:hypothetical protein
VASLVRSSLLNRSARRARIHPHIAAALFAFGHRTSVRIALVESHRHDYLRAGMNAQGQRVP